MIKSGETLRILRILQDQLSVDDQREDLAQSKQKINIPLLVFIRCRHHQEFLEDPDLFLEQVYIREVPALKNRVEIMELDFPQTSSRPLVEQKNIIFWLIDKRALLDTRLGKKR